MVPSWVIKSVFRTPPAFGTHSHFERNFTGLYRIEICDKRLKFCTKQFLILLILSWCSVASAGRHYRWSLSGILRGVFGISHSSGRQARQPNIPLPLIRVNIEPRFRHICQSCVYLSFPYVPRQHTNLRGKARPI